MSDTYEPAGYPTISRRERKKRDTHKRILDAAMELMADTPYDQVRIEDICTAADVANATFFLHFPNKSALVAAFNEDIAAKIADQLAGTRDGAAERLRQLLQIYLAEWGAHRHLMRQIVLEFIAQPTSDVSFTEVSPGLLGVVAGIVREGQKSGEFAHRIAAETAGLALVAAWNAIAISWAKTGDTKQAAVAHRQTLEVFLHGLLAPL